MNTRKLLVLVLSCLCLPLFSQEAALKLRTVVIDPGHGGHDAGCVSRDRQTKEKDLVLDIGKRLAEKIRRECPDVKVIMTRSDDRFIELYDRAKIANKANANLFISIHVDAVDTRRNPNWRTVNGYTVYTMGESKNNANMETIKRENSVILLEDDYTTKYQGFDPNDTESYIFFSLMQNANQEQSVHFGEIVSREMGKNGPFRHSKGIRQAPFLVLWRTAMPSVLVECGYITSEGDLAVLRTEEGRDKIAARLCRGFRIYKAEYEGTKLELEETKPAADTAAVRYGIQIMASGKRLREGDPALKGLSAQAVPSGVLYKYIVSVSTELSTTRENLPSVKKKFPDAFLVKMDENGVNRVK
ncbi:MAG: N-acetylmuramoyl-L-alanine amidase [Bacteroidales bacterium]|nr:N-acetylmuramoyl-L-alanine amidase [Bacteroidales bacterium]